MIDTSFLSTLKAIFKKVVPEAQVYLFGSQARGTAREDSDVDLLILLDRARISPSEEFRITDPLYDLELSEGIVISPMVMTKARWEESKYQSLFYHNVHQDGIRLQ